MKDLNKLEKETKLEIIRYIHIGKEIMKLLKIKNKKSKDLEKLITNLEKYKNGFNLTNLINN